MTNGTSGKGTMIRPASVKRVVTVIAGLLAICMVNTSAAINYDTAWTFVYDGGINNSNNPIPDYFSDVKPLPDGGSICVGSTADSANFKGILLVKLDGFGKIVWKKKYNRSGGGHSVVVAANGDFIIGGSRVVSPLIMRTDSLGNAKWSTWYYDSVKGQNLLLQSATINNLRETKRGTIICAVGDEYPDNGGQALSNYAACLEFKSDGTYKKGGQWNNTTGYNAGGFCIEEGSTGYYLLSGNQAVFYLDTNSVVVWKKEYTFSLNGVGTETNNISRAKMLRDGSLMVAGQAYEGNCWTRYQHFYYDAWHSPISYSYGTNASWDTVGYQGADDEVYDFTQLNNGNLVFVGTNGDFNAGGVWAFVTDSTGKNLLWEKSFRIPYKTDDGRAARPLSVCATTDSGFTVAGDYNCLEANGGMNGFVAHFKPASTAVVQTKRDFLNRSNGIVARYVGTSIVFSFPQSIRAIAEVSVYNATGKIVAKLSEVKTSTGEVGAIGDVSAFSRGVYFYKVNVSDGIIAGKIVVNR